MWLPKDDLKDSSSWSSTPQVLLRDIHNELLAKYEWKDSVSPQAQPGERSRSVCDSQGGVSQEQSSPLLLPQLDRLYDSNLWGENASKVIIPTQKALTHQILIL